MRDPLVLALIALCLGALGVTGCRNQPPAARPERLPVDIMVGPDGNPAGLIECGGGIRECYRVAGRICPNGYSVVDRESRVVGAHTTSTSNATRIGNTVVGGASSSTRVDDATSLMVSCPGIAERKNEIETASAERARKQNEENARHPRCGYTCAPQPRECPWLDDDGCYKPGFDPPEQ